jgi:predicted transposase YdaD
MAATPHDTLVQYVLGDPAHAAPFLRAVLPPEMARRFDWSSLHPEDAKFVNEVFRPRQGDLLFTAAIDGRRAFIYVHLEHQSTVDRVMAARMHIYAGRIWEVFLRREPTAAVLPAIVPVVLFHGPERWIAPTDVVDLLDLDGPTAAALAPCLPRSPFLLLDLDDFQDDALRKLSLTSLVRLALVLLRDSRSLEWPELRARLSTWADAFLEVSAAPGGLAAAAALMRYILLTSPATEQELQDFALELGPAASEAVMTAGERIRLEGEKRGLVKGRREAKAEVVLRQLTHRFGPLPASAAARVSAASLEELDRLVDRVLTAQSLEEALT